jgi:hypothetical protein
MRSLGSPPGVTLGGAEDDGGGSYEGDGVYPPGDDGLGGGV